MNILSYNENLLERLSLLLQNNFTSFNGTSKSLNSNDAKIRTNLVLLEQSSGPEDNVIPFSPFLHQRDEDCSKWIILFAKRHFDEDHQSFDLFGDIYRQMMSTVFVLSSLAFYLGMSRA
jgi:hypothetical protein